jgi:ATP-dependent Clp protease ATP-binding subunit ClpC
MPAPQPSLGARARWIVRTQLAHVSPARKHAPGVHTRATGFLPFSGPARDALGLAFRAARRDGQRFWGPGHLLLGLAAQDEGTAARALDRLGVSRERIRRQAEQIAAQDGRPAGAAARSRPGGLIQAALAEAAARCDYAIGTDHLLLALFGADDQAAAQALARLGAGESRVRGAVASLRAESGGERPGS